MNPEGEKPKGEFVFRDPRPEIDTCRVCGFDIRNRQEDYLLCPECGSPNNRTMAHRQTVEELAEADGWLAWRYWGLPVVLGAIAMFPGSVVVSLAAHWLALGWSWPKRTSFAAVGVVAPVIFFTAMMRMPSVYRWWPRVLVVSFFTAVAIAFLATLVLGVITLVIFS